MTGYIYALVDPRTSKIRYIGQTINLEQRYRTHCEGAETNPKGIWVSELRDVKLTPTLVVLEEVNERESMSYKEKWWIAVMKKRGCDLLNVASPTRKDVEFSELFESALTGIYYKYERIDKPAFIITKGMLVHLFGVLCGLMVLVSYIWMYQDVSRSSEAAMVMDYFRGFAASAITAMIIVTVYMKDRNKWFYLLATPSILMVLMALVKVSGNV